MRTSIIITLLLLLTQLVSGQQKMPEWFTENMETSIGTWITDNNQYKSENEPFDQYGMDWTWGIGKQSIQGNLYGIIDGKRQATFWEFTQYWDFEKNQGMVIQYGVDGTVGSGTMKPMDGYKHELIQTFTGPNGSFTTSHVSTLKNGTLVTTSFDIAKDGSKKPRRSYTWHITKNNNTMELGTFSISLAVKDIKASKTFYETLGFEMIDGNLDQNWAILKNGSSKIGLFQGMFPSNTLTFNPTNTARNLYQKAKESGLTIMHPNGMDKSEGPASFMTTDPDGNPILIDQH